MIRPHLCKDGRTTYGVRVRAAGGGYRWVGTFDTLEAAQEVDKSEARRVRKCVKCRCRFRPSDDRRIRCEKCIARMKQPGREDHWVYRCFDQQGELLYVGITSTGIKRFRRHGNDAQWWLDIARIEIEHMPDREAASWREQQLIKNLEPRYNVQYAGQPPEPEPPAVESDPEPNPYLDPSLWVFVKRPPRRKIAR